jgi:hypothetical protein
MKIKLFANIGLVIIFIVGVLCLTMFSDNARGAEQCGLLIKAKDLYISNDLVGAREAAKKARINCGSKEDREKADQLLATINKKLKEDEAAKKADAKKKEDDVKAKKDAQAKLEADKKKSEASKKAQMDILIKAKMRYGSDPLGFEKQLKDAGCDNNAGGCAYYCKTNECLVKCQKDHCK